MQYVFVGRQPIYDQRMRVHAYEYAPNALLGTAWRLARRFR